ncbi:ABC transporter permease, partial [Mesorhizobium sp. M00.F.Ca.ET.038.03.1.1]
MRQAPLSPHMTAALPVLGAASILLAWQYLLPLLGVPAY